MIWPKANQKTEQKQLNQIKFKEIKSFLIKSLVGVVLTLIQIINSQMNFIVRLLKNSREEKFIHLSETIFAVLT